MGLLSRLFSRKEPPAELPAADQSATQEDALTEAVLDFADSAKNSMQEGAAATGEVNIWDINDDEADEATIAAAAEATPEPTRRTRRPARNKTRILGFQPQENTVNDLFEPTEEPVAVSPNVMSMNATGWLVIVSGPGCGASYPLFSGMASIGRGIDQTIPLDFGDTSISRNNHAAIAYDPEEHVFYLGHGGKSNIVRLNGKPVVSTEQVKDGDEFLIGETTIRLRTFCSPDFNWETTTEGDDNVAIA